MQATIVNIAILGLFVFLFAAISWVRRDDRLRFWAAGWVFVLAHFAVELWQPSAEHFQYIQTCLSVDALALAGILYIISTLILNLGRTKSLVSVALIAAPTLVCLDMAIASPTARWALLAAVASRQALAAVAVFFNKRKSRPARMGVAALCILMGLWMIYGVLHGQPDVVIVALLGEIYFIAAIDFLTHTSNRSLGLNTVTAGLVAWGAVFPVGFWMQQLLPSIAVYPEIWNVPKFCAVVGMILIVLEEDTLSARSLTEEYRLLFASNPHPMWIFETSSLRFLDVNQSALEAHGYAREEMLKMKLTDVLIPSVRDDVEREIATHEPTPNRAALHVRKDGSMFPMDITSSGITFHGEPARFVLGLDVTEREALQNQIDYQAGHDHLTGLPNRILFPDLLSQAVKHAVQTGEKLAILSLDLDRFKRVNDTYGLRVGDECIQRVAAILGTRVRAMDIIARTGGEEFTIVLAGIKSSAAAQQTANELLEIFTQPLLIQGYKIHLSFSIGLAVCPEDGTDAAALWRGAERARDQAERAGGAQAAWLSSELQQASEQQNVLEAYLRFHLDDGAFRLAYQPIYNLEGELRGLEALLRLNHPVYGAVSPGTLVPIAEEAGLIVQLGEWVIEECCRQLLIWKSQGVPLVPVAINVSGLQLMHVDFAKRILATLTRYAIDPRWIHLEITESAAMRNPIEVADQMAALSARGILFSIDDFGTGHSSLGRLHQLPISVLKIDRSFVDRLCAQNSANSIVQAIIKLAHTLGHSVIAEGVETDQQLAALRHLGCDLLQGYLLSRPVAPEEIPELVVTLNPACDSQEPVGSGSIHVLPALTGTHGMD